MAVLLASSTWDRSCERPGYIVLTFQLTNRRVVNFLLFLLLLGAWFTVCSLGFAVSSKHPLKQTGQLLDGLGLTRGTATIPSTVGDRPVAFKHTPIYYGLITRNCMSPMLILPLSSSTEVASPGFLLLGELLDQANVPHLPRF